MSRVFCYYPAYYCRNTEDYRRDLSIPPVFIHAPSEEQQLSIAAARIPEIPGIVWELEAEDYDDTDYRHVGAFTS